MAGLSAENGRADRGIHQNLAADGNLIRGAIGEPYGDRPAGFDRNAGDLLLPPM